MCTMNTYKFCLSRFKPDLKYVKILKALIDNPNGLVRNSIYQISHKLIPLNRGWGSSTLAALRHYEYIDFVRHGHKCYWHITDKGKTFYYINAVDYDLT